MKSTRCLAFFLSLILIIGLCLPLAAIAEESNGTESSQNEIKDNPGITSGNAAVAYCIDDDQFLWADRIDEKVAPTVATKLVASMVVMDIVKENGLNIESTEVAVTEAAVESAGDVFDVRVPVMGLRAGAVYTVKNLLSATLVACANDAIAALADDFGHNYLGGDMSNFVDRMNEKVRALGLTNTNFTNPTGLDSPEQYTTPREVALIGAAFYQYNELVSLSDVESFIFNVKSTVRNKNYLKSNYFVDGFLNKNAIGLIAGQLNKQGNYCVITASQKDGRTYIFVIMCATSMIVERDEEDQVTYSFGDGNAYVDINKLINWVRNSFKLLTVATTESIVGELRVNLGNSTDHVMIVPAENVERLVPDIEGVVIKTTLKYDEAIVYKKEFNQIEYDTVDAPISAGQRLGTVTYTYNGIELATVDAVAREAIEADGVKASLNNAKSFLFGDTMKTVLYIIAGIVGLYILVVIVMTIIRTVGKFRKPKNDNDKNKPIKKNDKKSKSKEKDNGDSKAFTREIR